MNKQHLNKKEIQFLNKVYKNLNCEVLLEKIRSKWNTPEEWLKDYETELKHEGSAGYVKKYWILWAFVKGEKLPITFLNSVVFIKSDLFIKEFIEDQKIFFDVLEPIDKQFKKTTVIRGKTTILKICLAHNIRKIKNIVSLIENSTQIEGLCNHSNDLSSVKTIMYNMGYVNEITKTFGEKRKIQINKSCSSEFIKLINQFLSDMNLSKDTRVAKIGYLNRYFLWLNEKQMVIQIDNLKQLNKEIWLQYIEYVDTFDLSNKTKDSIITALRQFIDWLKIKHKDKVNLDFIAIKNDYKLFSKHHSTKNLSFEKRDYPEMILNYLINEYVPNDIYEEMYIAAIIISVNTGMRLSEIRNMEYKSVYFDKEDNIYKMALEYIDKVNNKNRVVYFTKTAYEQVNKVEKIREVETLLVPRYNLRVGRAFVHLFEYRWVSVLRPARLNKFFNDIKVNLNIVDSNNNPLDGFTHAMRHHYAVVMFIESGYNLSVIRHLLGHRDYKMTEAYLVEEYHRLTSEIVNLKYDKGLKLSGEGIETLVSKILGTINDGGFSKKVIEKYQWLGDMLKGNEFKKMTLGYCMNYCKQEKSGKKKRCFSCKNWIIDESESNELKNEFKSLLEVIVFKIYLFNIEKPYEESLFLKEYVKDLMLIYKELLELGVSNDELSDISIIGR